MQSHGQNKPGALVALAMVMLATVLFLFGTVPAHAWPIKIECVATDRMNKDGKVEKVCVITDALKPHFGKFGPLPENPELRKLDTRSWA